MTNLDWSIIAAIVTVIGGTGGGLVWLVDTRLDSKLDKFSLAISSQIGSMRHGIEADIKAELKEMREVVENLDADMTKLAADVAVLAVRIKGLEERKR